MKKIKGKGIVAKIINSMLGWIYKPSFCRKKKHTIISEMLL